MGHRQVRKRTLLAAAARGALDAADHLPVRVEPAELDLHRVDAARLETLNRLRVAEPHLGVRAAPLRERRVVDHRGRTVTRLVYEREAHGHRGSALHRVHARVERRGAVLRGVARLAAAKVELRWPGMGDRGRRYERAGDGE